MSFVYSVVAFLLLSHPRLISAGWSEDLSSDNVNGILPLLDTSLTIEQVYPPTWQEKWRPQLHLSTAAGWGDEPCGMVFNGTTYHVFYQHSPYKTTASAAHWRWASSKDLLYWTDHGVAIEPRGMWEDTNGVPNMWKGTAMKGNAVLDHENRAGYGQDAILLWWTDHTVEDGGGPTNPMEEQRSGYMLRNATRSSGYGSITHVDKNEAILQNDMRMNLGYWVRKGLQNEEGTGWVPDFVTPAAWERYNRDPKIIRLGGQVYIMAIANCDRITFYSSFNLKNWTPASSFGVYDLDDLRTADFKEHDPNCTAQSARPEWAERHGEGAAKAERDERDGEGAAKAELDEEGEEKGEGRPQWGGMEGSLWRSPDLIKLRVSGGDEAEELYVLLVSIEGRWRDESLRLDGGAAVRSSGTMYFVGTFEQVGQVWTFSPVEDPSAYPKWIDYGPDHTGGGTFYSDDMTEDVIVYQAWMSNWMYANRVPTFPWRSGMTLPRRLSLHKKEAALAPQYVLQQEFIDVGRLRNSRSSQSCVAQMVSVEEEDHQDGSDDSVSPNEECTFSYANEPGIEVMANVSGLTASNTFSIRFDNNIDPLSDLAEFVEIGLFIDNDHHTQNFYLHRSPSVDVFSPEFETMNLTTVQRRRTSPTTTVHAILDVSSIEVLFDEGEISFTAVFFPQKEPFHQVVVSVGDSIDTRIEATVWPLRSAKPLSRSLSSTHFLIQRAFIFFTLPLIITLGLCDY